METLEYKVLEVKRAQDTVKQQRMLVSLFL